MLETFRDATPDQHYALALASIAAMDNFEIVHEQNITTSAFIFFKHTITQTITVKIDGDNFYQLLECSDETVWSEDDILESWYVDEYLYADVGYGKMGKEHFSPEEFEGGIYDFDNVDGALLNVPAEWFKSSAFYDEGGEVYLEFMIDGEEYYKFLLNDGADVGFAGDAEGDVCYRVYFHEDGTVDRIYTLFKFIVEQDGIEVKASLEQTSTVKNIGTTTVTLPSSAASAEDGNWFYVR